MKGNYFRKKPDEFSMSINFVMDRKAYTKLSDIAEGKRIPVSSLIQRAIDNEFDQTFPFHYPCEIPDGEFTEDLYTEEAALIYKFLKVRPRDLESLVLYRRSVGIESKEVLLLAFRELLYSGVIEPFRPKTSYFNYVKGYVRYRPKEEKMVKARYKKLQLLGE